jgi:proteasome lid subunit RPN8/RPN11
MEFRLASQDETIAVVASVIEAMRAAARAAHPFEACGILTGDGVRITSFTPTTNVHAASQTRFEIDPQALIDAYRAERAGGASVMGFFHSHPVGKACPSATDRAMAAHDGRIWAIVAGEDMRFWRDTSDGFRPVPYALFEG